MHYQDIAAALFGEDEDKRKEARKCISAMSDAERKAFEAVKKAAFSDPDGDGDGKGADKDGDGDGKGKDGDGEKAAIAAALAETQASIKAAAARELALASQVQALEADAKKRAAADAAAADAAARAAIFAKRPDISQVIRATLATLSLEDLQKFVDAAPRVTAEPGHSVAATLAAGGASGGEGRGSHSPRLNADERRVFASLRPQTDTQVRATRRGSSLMMPVFYPSKEAAKARVAELDAELAAIHAERN